MTKSQVKISSTDTDPEMPQMLELLDSSDYKHPPSSESDHI